MIGIELGNSVKQDHPNSLREGNTDQADCCLRHRIPASIKASISPSSTAAVLPVSSSVRRSLTIW